MWAVPLRKFWALGPICKGPLARPLPGENVILAGSLLVLCKPSPAQHLYGLGEHQKGRRTIGSSRVVSETRSIRRTRGVGGVRSIKRVQ